MILIRRINRGESCHPGKNSINKVTKKYPVLWKETISEKVFLPFYM
jgi:ribonucleotide reductase beta subunit family protein with ferritin-like domain